jgi:hypothetical protein
VRLLPKNRTTTLIHPPPASVSADFSPKSRTNSPFPRPPNASLVSLFDSQGAKCRLNGLILDFELAPANETDLEVGFELLAEHTDLTVIGDKGYISADKAATLWRNNRIRLQTLPRRNQKKQMPASMRRLFNSVRQIIETVNGQLTEQFHIETNHAHSFWGLCARLYTKLTAHTLCIYINRLLGNPDFLQIKALAFPI